MPGLLHDRQAAAHRLPDPESNRVRDRRVVLAQCAVGKPAQ
jgi:hypothetical protein